MSEFKPQHDVSKSGRMAFAEGPEGECVAVFDLVRWLQNKSASGDISAAIQTTIDKLHAAVAGGCSLYETSARSCWMLLVPSNKVFKSARPLGNLAGAYKIDGHKEIDGEFYVTAGLVSIKATRPMVGPVGAVEFLGECLSACMEMEDFARILAGVRVPKLGIRRADAVALFGYPPASTGEVQVGVSQAAAATGDKAESTHEAAVATLEDRVVELYDSGVLSPSEIVRRIGRDSWPPGKPDSARTSVSRMIARHQQKKAKAIEERQKAARAGPWDQAKPA